jgi:hypothetical protein
MRNRLVSFLALAAATILPTELLALDGRVEIACAHDYLTYCSRHNPDGSAARHCMRKHDRKLSKACVNALIAAGEVSKQQVDRRSRR